MAVNRFLPSIFSQFQLEMKSMARGRRDRTLINLLVGLLSLSILMPFLNHDLPETWQTAAGDEEQMSM